MPAITLLAAIIAGILLLVTVLLALNMTVDVGFMQTL